MNTQSLDHKIGRWMFLLLFLLGQQVTLAATGEIEYRLERMVPQTMPFDKLTSQINKITVALDGSLWISDLNNNIYHFNADGSFIRSLDSYGHDLGVALDGSLWVADASAAQIKRFNADGALIGMFKIDDYQDYQTTNIALSRDGTLWVARNNLIKHFKADGTFLNEFRVDNNINSIAAAVDGSLWILSSLGIQHIHTDGSVIAEYLLNDSSDSLSDIAIAVDNSVWISNFYKNRLEHFDSNANIIAQFDGKGKNQLYQPRSIALAWDGSLWVADQDVRLQHFNTNANSLNKIGALDQVYFGFSPSDLAVAKDNSIWVADTNNHRIQHFASDGILLGELGSLSSNSVQFTKPSGIEIALDGSLWVIDSNEGIGDYPGTQNYRLQHLQVDGTLISQLFGNSSGPPGSSQIITTFSDLSIAPSGDLWLIETSSTSRGTGSHVIKHLNPNGSLIAEFPYHQNDFLIHPIHIKAAYDSSLWLLDSFGPNPWEPYPIKHYKVEGNLATELDRVVFQGDFFTDLAPASNGSVWLLGGVDKSDRLNHFSANGVLLEQFNSNAGSGDWSSDRFVLKTIVTLDNAIWIVDSRNHRLQKFKPYPKSKTPHPFKAILVAGNITDTNQQWNSTWQSLEKANHALKLQGFMDEEIVQYNNGQKDSLHETITQWAKDSTDVVLYLTGQVKTGKFEINNTESVSSKELSEWLTELEKNLPTNGKVTVVIESPDAGSFVSALANPTRPHYVITSTQAGQPALMADHCVNSFSYAFWSRVMDGAPLADAFVAGQQAIEPFIVNGQVLQPTGDANGNGQADAQDATAVGNYCLGMCNKTATQLPAVNLPGQPSLTFKAASSLDFNVNVRPAANTHLLETWALVQRPAALGADPANALSLEKIPLSCDTNQHCTGRYQRFDAPGQYRVHFYALDSQYQLNAPAFLDITIQPENTSTLPAEYDSRQGLLTLRDVNVGGQHYQAALQYQDGLYYLLTLGLTPNVLSPAARFDAATNLLDIPLARVNGQDYQGSFRLVDVLYLFELLAAAPK